MAKMIYFLLVSQVLTHSIWALNTLELKLPAMVALRLVSVIAFVFMAASVIVYIINNWDDELSPKNENKKFAKGGIVNGA